MARSAFAPALCVAYLSGAVSAQTPDQAAAALGLEQAEVVHVQMNGYPGAAATASFAIDGVLHMVELEPYSLRADGFRLIEQREGDVYVDVQPQVALTYAGLIPSLPGSVVRGSWLGDGLHLRMRMADGTDLWLEPLQDKVVGASADSHALYRSTDVIATGATCGTDVSDASAASSQSAGREELLETQGGFLTAQLALDADFEYYQSKGSSTANTQAQMEAVINQMNLQYEQDCGVTHVVSAVIIRTSNNDPYSSSSPGTLLSQMTNHWNNQQQGVQRDVAELFTGKNLNGSVIGIAWLSGVCNSQGYNVVQSDCCGSMASKTDLSAHELGHNWGEGHCSCSSYTMNSWLTSSNQFHPTFSIPGIINYAETHGCISGGPGGGTHAPSVITGVSPASVDAVNPQPVTLLVEGSGFTGATKVTVGGVELLLFPPQWQIVDDSTITISLPQLPSIGNQPIVVEDPLGDGTSSIVVGFNPTPTIDLVNSNPAFLLSAVGAEVRMGSAPGDTMFLAVSPVLGATSLPGLFSAGIGAGSLANVIYINSFIVDPVTGWTSVTVPFDLPTGFAIHFQAFNLSALSPSLPLAATNVESGTVVF